MILTRPRLPEFHRAAGLEAEIETLRARVRDLERALGGEDWAPIELRLGPTETRLFALLLRRPLLSRETAWTVFYGDRDADGPPPKIFDVWIARMRPKLRPFGIEIATRWRVGWEMPSESKAKARALIAARADA